MKTLEEVLARVKQQTAKQERHSDARKLEARLERAKRKSTPTSIYAREELWLPVAIHREYEVQHCDSCKTEITVFAHQKMELQHKIDKSARRWCGATHWILDIDRKAHEHARRWDTGVSEQELPLHVTLTEHVVPECFCCYSLGRFSTSLWKGKVYETHKIASDKNEETSSSHAQPSNASEGAGVTESVACAPQEMGREDRS